MRFIEDLPIIEEKLPVCPDGTDISISYYLFNKGTTSENPTGEGFPVMHYAYETAYAYKQLIRHTNIAACGRVRIFMDKGCETQMRPYFEQIGLDPLIEIIDVPMGVRLSGYLPQLSHEAVAPCKYRFHCDVDLWWIDPHESGEIFDWQAFCAFLDEADTDSFFGQPIEKQSWIYQVNYSQHAHPDDIQEKALQTLQAIFGPRIPDQFHDMAYEQHTVLKERNDLSPLRCYAGWFIGVRENSNPLWYINKLYKEHEEYLSDDEGLFSLLFYLYPEIKQYQVLQGIGEAKEHEIQQRSLLNYIQTDGVATLNVGASEFYMDAYKQERQELATLFRDDENAPTINTLTKPKTIELPPAPNGLNTFGRHIVGTYALDASGNIYPLLTHSENNHSVMFGFPAALEPVMTPLPNANKKDAEIALFYCLFHHPLFHTHDTHVYAKSMIYAYKQLITHTNIQDVGRVHFFIDKRCIDVVYPYCKAANVQKLIVPFDSTKQVQYAAYIPCFWHHAIEDVKYRIYMDVDMWWINLHHKPPFDYQHFVEEAEKLDADIFGNTVPKSAGEVEADLYVRSVWENDTHIEQTKQWVHKNFPEGIGDIRAISGCHNGIRKSETLDKLKNYYNEVGEFIRDDEAFWAVFLTKYPEIQVKNLHEIISGTGYSVSEYEHHDKPQLAHIGTYMFEHFYNKPLAETFYNHCKEGIQ